MALRVPSLLVEYRARPALGTGVPLDHAQELARLGELRKKAFFVAKLARVHAAPATVESDRMLQMQHLVKQNVFNRVARHARVVEHTADDDCVVRRIIVAKTAASVVLAPGKLRTSHESVKETPVEVVEDLLKMVVMSASGADMFASAHLPHEPRLGGDVVAGNIAAITGVVGAINGLAIQLGEQNVRNRVQYRFRSAFQKVGEPNIEFSLAHADRVVDGNKGIETRVQGRCGRSGSKFAIGFVENFAELWRHVRGRVARPAILIKIAESTKI